MGAYYTPCKMAIQDSGADIQFEPVQLYTQANTSPIQYEAPIPKEIPFTSLLWHEFRKSIYPIVAFHSIPELIFAGVLERDGTVIEWVNPPRRIINIHGYEPDFFVETENGKYLCEIKMRSQCDSKEVRAKAETALEWCEAANLRSDKSWKYFLIPHDKVVTYASFEAYLKYEWPHSPCPSFATLQNNSIVLRR